ncbi:hypothetical protein Verru16b_03119 [Lacunisphaera limnophila]|uniref:Uncharacterized protein n=1 Tax=Lacunisphaera limnophila TaxID=1838286 RepID=A0A1D8AYS5_9BACT|nr:hypothetical protein [Lacunisphaera limnophila]AOS46025.1 hypothetical protein Verru16b_03119 [Lacunisphaera limnophila]
MKSLIIVPCLAASAAVAAELKDPTAVAQEWQQAAEQARQPLGPSRTLAALSDDLTTTPLERIFSPDNLPPLPPPAVRPPLLDAPSTKIPDHLPNLRPRGAVPYEYNGEVYWLVPLSTPARK